MQEAYEILSDSEKRGMYDRFGMSAVKGDGGGMGGFSFGGGGGGLFDLLGGGAGDIFGCE